MVICLNYGHFENKLRSVIISQNHYLNQILDVHPLKILANELLMNYFNLFYCHNQQLLKQL